MLKPTDHVIGMMLNFKIGRFYDMLKQATSHKPQATSHKPQATSHKRKLGFTLSELLVSLAILGLIAGLTVPSIVVAVEKGKNKTLMKESLQTISQIVQEGVLNGDFDAMTDFDVQSPTSPLVQYFTNRLNAKNCPKDTLTPPCNISAENVDPSHGTTNHSGRWILNNGVQIFIHAGWPTSWALRPYLNFYIDTKPAPVQGSKFGAGGDQLWILCNIGSTPLVATTNSQVTLPIPLKSAQCGASTWNNNDQLYNALFN